MALIEKLTTVTKCDFCGKVEGYCDHCEGCGKHVCYECCKDSSKVVKYIHAIYVHGSGDGIYCHDCDRALESTELHKRFVAVKKLRDEYQQWFSDFDSRRKAAEEQLKDMPRRKERC